MIPENFRWSKSSVNSLLRCPKQFELEYIGKHKRTSPAMQKGLAIHKYIDKINKNDICLNTIPKSYKSDVMNYVKFLKNFNLPLPSRSEFEITMEYDGLPYVGHPDAFWEKEGLLLDYKSGRLKYSLSEYRFELQLYSLMIEKELKMPVKEYGILFTDKGIFLRENNNRQYEAVTTQMNKVKNLIKESELKKINIRSQCSLCDFKSLCNKVQI